jgi:hypothetical protein
MDGRLYTAELPSQNCYAPWRFAQHLQDGAASTPVEQQCRPPIMLADDAHGGDRDSCRIGCPMNDDLAIAGRMPMRAKDAQREGMLTSLNALHTRGESTVHGRGSSRNPR